MTTTAFPLSTIPSHSRWFYSAASLGLLVLVLIGFQLFYLHGTAFPGRPITPPIRTLIIFHGCLMTAWMLLAVGQPLLIGTRRKHLHRKLGVLGVVLAACIVLVGVRVGIESARVKPPGLRLWGLDAIEFMAVPVFTMLIFGLCVLIGVMNRRRPQVHRPMMLMASISLVGAALGRVAPLNALYADTWFEVVFTAFFMQVIVAAILLITKCLVTQSFDQWLAAGFAALTVASVAISLGAKTQAWDQVATFLLR